MISSFYVTEEVDIPIRGFNGIHGEREGPGVVFP